MCQTPYSDAQTELTITLRPVGDGPPAACRFRRGLKILLRQRAAGIMAQQGLETAASDDPPYCEMIRCAACQT